MGAQWAAAWHVLHSPCREVRLTHVTTKPSAWVGTLVEPLPPPPPLHLGAPSHRRRAPLCKMGLERFGSSDPPPAGGPEQNMPGLVRSTEEAARAEQEAPAVSLQIGAAGLEAELEALGPLDGAAKGNKGAGSLPPSPPVPAGSCRSHHTRCSQCPRLFAVINLTPWLLYAPLTYREQASHHRHPPHLGACASDGRRTQAAGRRRSGGGAEAPAAQPCRSGAPHCQPGIAAQGRQQQQDGRVAAAGGRGGRGVGGESRLVSTAVLLTRHAASTVFSFLELVSSPGTACYACRRCCTPSAAACSRGRCWRSWVRGGSAAEVLLLRPCCLPLHAALPASLRGGSSTCCQD